MTDMCVLCSGHYTIEDAPWFLWQQGATCQPHCDTMLAHQATSAIDRIVPPRQQGANQLLPELADWTPVGPGDNGVFLFGDVGRGKSYQAAALLRAGWMQWVRATGSAPSVQWWQIARLLQQIRSTMNRDTKDGREWFTSLYDCSMLVLDDLGAERVTDWTREQVLLVISERYDRGAVTIVTSNFTLGDLAARLTPTDDPANPGGKRIVSRIAEASRRVEVVGPDRRLAASK